MAKKTAPRSKKVAEHGALEAFLNRVFEAYACHFLKGELKLPPYTARLDGATVELHVAASDETIRVRRRASAYLMLAGGFWGATQEAAARTALPSLIASLTDNP